MGAAIPSSPFCSGDWGSVLVCIRGVGAAAIPEVDGSMMMAASIDDVEGSVFWRFGWGETGGDLVSGGEGVDMFRGEGNLKGLVGGQAPIVKVRKGKKKGEKGSSGAHSKAVTNARYAWGKELTNQARKAQVVSLNIAISE